MNTPGVDYTNMLGEALDALSEPVLPDRKVVGPPQRADKHPKPEVPVNDNRVEVGSDDTPPLEQGSGADQPALPDVVASVVAKSTTTAKRGRPAKADATRTTTAELTLELVESLRLLRLQEQASGRRWVQTEWLDAAVLALPTNMPALGRLLDTHGVAINLDVPTRSESWRPTTQVTLRMSETAFERLNKLKLLMYQRERRLIGTGMLLALAIASSLQQ